MSQSSLSQSSWGLDSPSGEDHDSGVIGSPGQSEEREVSDYNSFRIDFVLSSEDLEVIRMKYHIFDDFKLEVAGPGELIALPQPGRINVYEELLKTSLKLSFHFFNHRASKHV
ncbi:hypothetical protein COCNU_03G007670 [Cocos nucifera]|uniref:Uncharacterized protein n=1 Tax=Cocos nucifera TaxID=13894 RepID=A0A8K0MYM0_COCNU|nr:hypothetical protein COCNU_03G007670 [Cocos nucifera]